MTQRVRIAIAARSRTVELAKHIAACPIGYAHGKPITHRSTTDAEIVEWVARLDELARGT